ncbi:hypothetical protein ACEPAF_4032 [Sanghuangporus sanghuang]
MSTHFAVATTAKGILEQVQLPTPQPGPGNVLIKVHYAALIPPDTYQLDRGYMVSDYPNVLGFASAGVVKAVGHGVTDLKEGDKVSSFNYPARENKALQEYTLVPRYLVAKLPDTISLHEAASMPDNYATAMVTIFGTANLALPLPESFPAPMPPPNANVPILVYGAGASSGQYMIQIFKLAGYTNIFVTASSHNHAYLKELGAKHCFDYKSPDFAKDILQASGGAKMSIIVDTVAAKPSMEVYKPVVGEETRLALLMPVKEGAKVTNDLSSEYFMAIPPWVESLFSEAKIIPVYTFRLHEDPIARENFLQKILPQLLEKRIIRPNPIRLFKEGPLLDRAKTGLDLLRNNKVSGEKVVIDLITN